MFFRFKLLIKFFWGFLPLQLFYANSTIETKTQCGGYIIVTMLSGLIDKKTKKLYFWMKVKNTT